MKKLVMTVLVAAVPLPVSLAQVPPEKAERTFTVHDRNLEWKLWASEPLFANPTSMDIDHLGRVWVCESVNYRHTLHKKPPTRPAGDRILILEDSHGTGRADKVTVFYQSPELLAPLGIAVAKDPVGPAWKLYVCQSPDILVFEDKDGDGKADGPPKKLLTGFRGVDHDHGVHGILIGPDGKLYFSVGDQGVKDLQSSDGKGRKWTTNHTDCQAGTIWRCDLDGTNLELIAHNFRNEYEPCVDSFGNIWTSDNDDDGNQQTRICFVMPGGNYGYWPRGKGESHWHEEQPGVVPKVLRTGFGSPTGMCVYEGTLLPEKYRGQLLHTDAGPRQLRCYHTKPKGAGYEIDREDIVTSTDNWFRPSDVCVAPDGSVFVADWYDPGVGGHGMGDTTRGRIYRLAPKGSKYAVPEFDVMTESGMLKALDSPAISARALAIARLRSINLADRLQVLHTALAKKDQPTLMARSIWHWKEIVENRPSTLFDPVMASFESKDRRIHVSGCRALTTLMMRAASVTPTQLADQLRRMPKESTAQRDMAEAREALLWYRDAPTELAAVAIVPYSTKFYDGHDRFYLAALGIAVGADPKRREVILADFDKHFPEWNDKVADLVWELRPPSVMPRLPKLLADAKLPPHQRARLVDILATGPDTSTSTVLLRALVDEPSAEVRERILVNLKLFLPTKWKDLNRGKDLTDTIDRLLGRPDSAALGLALIAAAERVDAIPRIRRLLDGRPPLPIAREAVRTLGALPGKEAVDLLREELGRGEATLGPVILEALGLQIDARKNNPGGLPALAILQDSATAAGTTPQMREAALSALVGSRTGTEWLLAQQVKHKLPAEVVSVAGRYARSTPYPDLRNRALIAFPPPAKLDINKLPPLANLATRRGDPERGKQVLTASLTGDAQCLKCHSVKGVGGNVGPDLSAIGTKASRENLYESILYPNKAIADQFVQWTVTTARGTSISGLLVEDAADHLTIRDANGKDTRIARRDVVDKEKSPNSLMPSDSAQALTVDEIVDLVEYLVTLQTAIK